MDSDRKAKSVSGLHIKHADNGGYVVRHDYDNSMAGPSYQPSTEHAFTTHDEMMKHVGKHLSSGFKGKQGLSTSTQGMATVKGNIANPQAPEGTTGKPKKVRQPQGVQPNKHKGWRSGQGLRQGQAAALPKGVQSKAPTKKTYGAGVD